MGAEWEAPPGDFVLGFDPDSLFVLDAAREGLPEAASLGLGPVSLPTEDFERVGLAEEATLGLRPVCLLVLVVTREEMLEEADLGFGLAFNLGFFLVLAAQRDGVFDVGSLDFVVV